MRTSRFQLAKNASSANIEEPDAPLMPPSLLDLPLLFKYVSSMRRLVSLSDRVRQCNLEDQQYQLGDLSGQSRALPHGAVAFHARQPFVWHSPPSLTFSPFKFALPG